MYFPGCIRRIWQRPQAQRLYSPSCCAQPHAQFNVHVQALVGILVVNVALLAQIRWQPFEADTLDALETTGLAVSTFTLCVCWVGGHATRRLPADWAVSPRCDLSDTLACCCSTTRWLAA